MEFGAIFSSTGGSLPPLQYYTPLYLRHSLQIVVVTTQPSHIALNLIARVKGEHSTE